MEWKMLKIRDGRNIFPALYSVLQCGRREFFSYTPQEDKVPEHHPFASWMLQETGAPNGSL